MKNKLITTFLFLSYASTLGEKKEQENNQCPNQLCSVHEETSNYASVLLLGKVSAMLPVKL